MFWVAETPRGEAWFVAPGVWWASDYAERAEVRARLAAGSTVSAGPMCPSFPVNYAEVSSDALAAALVAVFGGDVSLPARIFERVVPPVPEGAVS